jgi:hypothetical protein
MRASCAISTVMSMSLSGRCSPRATEPNSAPCATPRSQVDLASLRFLDDLVARHGTGTASWRRRPLGALLRARPFSRRERLAATAVMAGLVPTIPRRMQGIRPHAAPVRRPFKVDLASWRGWPGRARP